MKSLDFRTTMLNAIRGFDSWAWKDVRDNPSDYENMEFSDWFNMFREYLENEVV